MRGYFNALKDAGFSEDQAMDLTRDYHTSFTERMLDPEDD